MINPAKILVAAAVLCVVAFGSNSASATVSFTCDPNVSAPTCAALNTTVSGYYSQTFTNANANIYIQYGTTGLGSSTTGFFNPVSYSTYTSALAAEGGIGVVRADAIASLPGAEPSLYGTGDIEITSALGQALGISGLNGTTAGGSICAAGSAGCYNGIITITNDPSTPLYYRNGAQDPNSYDYYTTVEHEVDEVLGASSCVSTTGAALASDCADGESAAAVDLFRYNGAGNRVFIDTTSGAYFSYDGGVTNGANGNVYNTVANGNDYADFVSTCPGILSVQDGSGCPGTNGLDITNDGGAEINILDAVGFDLRSTGAVPEPAVWTMMLVGMLGTGVVARRARRKVAVATQAV
jgi:hypothetical protein